MPSSRPTCAYCIANPAVLKRPKTGQFICKPCFLHQFEAEVHHTIVSNKLFIRGDTVAIGASGGKDSAVLAEVLYRLNKQHDYGLNLVLLSIDEGIKGYRDDSLACVYRSRDTYDIPLKVVSYSELYGYTMDQIVSIIGTKNNCTFCGVFRRQALDRGATLIKANKIVTGHNADDIAETVLMNILRGDISRLGRSVDIVTGENSGSSCGHTDSSADSSNTTDNDAAGFASLPRCKPFKYSYEKEIVMYAYHRQLDYFSTECIYSPYAYRGFAREYLKQLERVKPAAILDIILSAEHFEVNTVNSSTNKAITRPVLGSCSRCGYLASNEICKACVLLEGLRRTTERHNKQRAKQILVEDEASTIAEDTKQLTIADEDEQKRGEIAAPPATVQQAGRAVSSTMTIAQNRAGTNW